MWQRDFKHTGVDPDVYRRAETEARRQARELFGAILDAFNTQKNGMVNEEAIEQSLAKAKHHYKRAQMGTFGVDLSDAKEIPYNRAFYQELVPQLEKVIGQTLAHALKAEPTNTDFLKRLAEHVGEALERFDDPLEAVEKTIRLLKTQGTMLAEEVETFFRPLLTVKTLV